MGYDDDGVLAAEGFLIPWHGFHPLPFRMLAGGAYFRDMGVVVRDFGTKGLEVVEQFEGWRLAHVIDIRFVSETKQKHPAAFDGFAQVIEGDHGAVHHVFRHGAVDLAGEFDETGVDAEFASLPSKVKRVDRDAVAAKTWTGIERGEAEGLGGGGADDFPDVDAHGIGNDLHFIGEADVDGAVDVFEQLGEFGDLGGGDGDHRIESRLIEGGALFQAGGCVAADDLGNVGGAELRVAGILTLRGIDDEDGISGNPPAGFDAWDDFLRRGARVGGAFEGEDAAGFQVWDDGIQSVPDVGEVGFEVSVEGGGDAEDDGIGFRDAREVGGGVKRAAGESGGDVGRRDVFDVTLTAEEMCLFALVYIETDGTKALVGIGEKKRKTDIAESDNGDGGRW